MGSFYLRLEVSHQEQQKQIFTWILYILCILTSKCLESCPEALKYGTERCDIGPTRAPPCNYPILSYPILSYPILSYPILFHSIPFHSTPFHSTPFHSIPFHSIPFHSIPLHSTPFQILFYYTLYSILHYILLYIILFIINKIERYMHLSSKANESGNSSDIGLLHFALNT